MTDESAPTPDPNAAVRAWAQEWADQYNQTWTDELMTPYVGKTVQGVGMDVDGNPRGFTGKVVGYSRDSIFFPLDEHDSLTAAYRSSFLLATGVQVPIFADMTFTEVEAE